MLLNGSNSDKIDRWSYGVYKQSRRLLQRIREKGGNHTNSRDKAVRHRQPTANRTEKN